MATEIVTRSGPLRKALVRASQEYLYSRRGFMRAAEPGANRINFRGDKEPGIFSAGESGVAGNRIEITPFLRGRPGAWCWMRVVGWRPVPGTDATQVWRGVPLAEFYCVAGDVPGPARRPGGTAHDRTVPDRRVVDDAENLCDFVALYRGSLGVGAHAGSVVQYGRGSNVPAVIVMDLRGSKKFSFDFAVCPHYPLAANALWSWA